MEQPIALHTDSLAAKPLVVDSLKRANSHNENDAFTTALETLPIRKIEHVKSMFAPAKIQFPEFKIEHHIAKKTITVAPKKKNQIQNIVPVKKEADITKLPFAQAINSQKNNTNIDSAFNIFSNNAQRSTAKTCDDCEVKKPDTSILGIIGHWALKLFASTSQKLPTISVAGILQHIPRFKFFGDALEEMNIDLRFSLFSFQNACLFKKVGENECFNLKNLDSRAEIELRLPAFTMPVLAAAAKTVSVILKPSAHFENTDAGQADLRKSEISSFLATTLAGSTLLAPALNAIPVGRRNGALIDSAVRIKLSYSWSAIKRMVLGEKPTESTAQIEVNVDKEIINNPKSRLRTAITTGVIIRLNDPARAVYTTGIKEYVNIVKRFNWLQDAEISAKMKFIGYDITSGKFDMNTSNEPHPMAMK